MQGPLVGVLALQGAFEEHQQCLEAIGCQTRQVRTVADLEGLQGIVLPGGESTAMGLIGTGTGRSAADKAASNLWDALREFCHTRPTWGTCAGMILLADKCIGASAVITHGQALIGGLDLTVCRNYFGSQISSFEMPTPPPPALTTGASLTDSNASFPGVFIRAPAILAAGPDVTVLGRVHATPCRQAAVTLAELDRKIATGEPVLQQLSVVDAIDRSQDGLQYKKVVVTTDTSASSTKVNNDATDVISLPGAADGGTARHVICAVQKNQLLCTAFHPELTDDYRWHEYFVNEIVKKHPQAAK